MTADEHRSDPSQHSVLRDGNRQHGDAQNTAAHNEIFKPSAQPGHSGTKHGRQQEGQDAHRHTHIHNGGRNNKNIQQIQYPRQCGNQRHNLQTAARIPVRLPLIFQKNEVHACLFRFNRLQHRAIGRMRPCRPVCSFIRDQSPISVCPCSNSHCRP